jgi:hypothetical protein
MPYNCGDLSTNQGRTTAKNGTSLEQFALNLHADMKDHCRSCKQLPAMPMAGITRTDGPTADDGTNAGSAAATANAADAADAQMQQGWPVSRQPTPLVSSHAHDAAVQAERRTGG